MLMVFLSNHLMACAGESLIWGWQYCWTFPSNYSLPSQRSVRAGAKSEQLSWENRQLCIKYGYNFLLNHRAYDHYRNHVFRGPREIKVMGLSLGSSFYPCYMWWVRIAPIAQWKSTQHEERRSGIGSWQIGNQGNYNATPIKVGLGKKISVYLAKILVGKWISRGRNGERQIL